QLTTSSCLHTTSLHDALPILARDQQHRAGRTERRTSDGVQDSANRSRKATPISATATHTSQRSAIAMPTRPTVRPAPPSHALIRSEEHTSELQSRVDLVCRLL